MSRLPLTQADHRLGKPDSASIQLVVYGDYQCGYTTRGLVLVGGLIEELGDALLFVFRNFPMPEIHAHAFQAALAAEAADRQHRFWEMHLHLIQHQRRLDDLALLGYARELALDERQFTRDFVADATRRRVITDRLSGERLGVSSTPTFFVNGAKYEGPVDGLTGFVAAPT